MAAIDEYVDVEGEYNQLPTSAAPADVERLTKNLAAVRKEFDKLRKSLPTEHQADVTTFIDKIRGIKLKLNNMNRSQDLPIIPKQTIPD